MAPAHPGPLLDWIAHLALVADYFCIFAVSCIYDSWCCNFRRVLMARHTNSLNDLPWSVKRVSAAWETNHNHIIIDYLPDLCEKKNGLSHPPGLSHVLKLRFQNAATVMEDPPLAQIR